MTDPLILCRLRGHHAWDDAEADDASCLDCETRRTRTETGWRYTYPPPIGRKHAGEQ